MIKNGKDKGTKKESKRISNMKYEKALQPEPLFQQHLNVCS